MVEPGGARTRSLRRRAEIWFYRRLRPLIAERPERSVPLPPSAEPPEARRSGLLCRARKLLVAGIAAAVLSGSGYLAGRAVEARDAALAAQEEARMEARCLALAERIADGEVRDGWLAERYAELRSEMERAKRSGEGDVGWLPAVMAEKGYEPEDVILLSCLEGGQTT
ncbi:MAG: hypothetical protein AB1425_01455 [Actinomycetota bacterium]